MKRWLVWLVGALVIVSVGGAAYLGFRSAQTDDGSAPQVPVTVAVTLGDVQQTVIAPGLLVGTQTTTVSTEAGGRLVEIDVRPGDGVRAGACQNFLW